MKGEGESASLNEIGAAYGAAVGVSALIAAPSASAGLSVSATLLFWPGAAQV